MDNILIRVWKEKDQIFDGIRNSVFKKEHIEEVSEARLTICKSNVCGQYDTVGTSCAVKGTQPCCAACGCSMKLKSRSLASKCPKGYWGPEVTPEEEFHIRANMKE